MKETQLVKQNGKVANRPAVPSKAEKDNATRRKVKVVSLHFPINYNEPILYELMHIAYSFHLWFEREPSKPEQIKKGGLSFSFDSDEAAKEAYMKLRRFVAEKCAKFKVQGSKWLENECDSILKTEIGNIDSPASYIEEKTPTSTLVEKAPIVGSNLLTPNEEVSIEPIVEPIKNMEEKDPRKLFVCQLLPTTDDDLIYAVFGQENLVNVEIRSDERKKDGTKMAILTFHSVELADQSKQDYDGFVVDDGELSKPMRILTHADYVDGKYLGGSSASTNLPKESIPTPVLTDSTTLTKQEMQVIMNPTNQTDLNMIGKIGTPVEQEKLKAKQQKAASSNQQDEAAKGKAGNLWSAQIVSNRSGDGAWDAIVKCIDIPPKQPSPPVYNNQSNQDHQSSITAKTDNQRLESHPLASDHFGYKPNNQSILQIDNDNEDVDGLDPSIEFIDDRHGHLETVNSSLRHANELSDEQLSRLIDGHVLAHRVNWAELHSLHDLWQLVHAAVEPTAGWQPEMALKRGMMASLRDAMMLNDAPWWQSHVDYLIKLWQKELDQENRSKVRKEIQLATPISTTGDVMNGLPPTVRANESMAVAAKAAIFAPDDQQPSAAQAYQPLPPSPKRRPAAKKRKLVELMGVGAFLASVQREEALKRESPALSGASTATNGSLKKKKAKKAAVAPKRSRPSGNEEAQSSDSDSSCESGEASSTEGSTGESSRAASAEPPPPPPPPKNRFEKRQQRQNDQYEVGAGAAGMGAASQGSPAAMQPMVAPAGSQWPPNVAATVSQMMPALMQMMQTRMNAPGGLQSLGPQFQHQFSQLHQQIQSQIGSTGQNAAVAAPSAQQMMNQFMQLQQQLQHPPGGHGQGPAMMAMAPQQLSNSADMARQMMFQQQNQNQSINRHPQYPNQAGYHYR